MARKTRGSGAAKSNQKGQGQQPKFSSKRAGAPGSNAPDQAKAKSSGYGLNDPSWYSRYPDLLAAAARLPFPYRPGTRISNAVKLLGSNTVDRDIDIPGIYGIKWVPSIGSSSDTVSPASMAARELYTRVRSQFSGPLSADAPDFLIQIMAIDSVYAYIAYLKRIYRFVNSATPENYFIPYGALTAMGFSADAVQGLMSGRVDFWGKINALIHMTDRLICPDVFDVIKRHYWMSDNVYLDAPTANSQIYMFIPEGFLKFGLKLAPDGTTQVGGLNFNTLDTALTSTGDNVVENLYQYGFDLITALTDWEDCFQINGYLRAAFGDTSMFTVGLLELDERIVAVFQPEVLAQIENATAMPINSTDFGDYAIEAGISQDPSTNALISAPRIVLPDADIDDISNMVTWNGGGVLNLHADLPSIEDVVTATRLHALYRTAGSTSGNVGFFVDCASEFVTRFTITSTPMTLLSTLTGAQYETITFGGTIMIGGNSSAVTGDDVKNLIVALKTTSFDWSPIIAIGLYTSVTSQEFTLLCDTANMTKLTADEVLQLNRICLYSEFNAFSIR